MKKLKLSLCTLILFIGSLTAQDCSSFYPFQEGVISQITTYNKKGKAVSIVDYTVTKVRTTNQGETATISGVIKDDRGEQITEMDYDIVCSGDSVSIDFESMLDSQMQEQYKDVDIEITGTDINLPNNLSVGQSLADADMNMRIDMGGIGMNMTVQMVDRIVEEKESVTTSAGTFDCFVISYTLKTKMGMSRESKSKQWIAQGVGMVKQEDYNKKGKLTSSSILTMLSK